MPRSEDSLGMVGLIMTIAGVVLSCCSVGCSLILCPIGLVLCIIAHHRRPTGLSLAGLIIGGFGTLLFILVLAYYAYIAMHPELRDQMMKQFFDQMDMPMPPGFPRR